MKQAFSRIKLYINSHPHLFLAISLLVILRIPSLFESFWYGDEGIYAAIADAIRQGQALYTDVWDHKPPLLYWVYLLGSLVQNWDIGIIIVKFLGLVASIGSLLLLHPILHQLFKSNSARTLPLFIAAVLLGLPLLEPNTANAEVFFIPVNLAILWLMLNRKRPVIIGALLGVSLLIKFHSFFEASLVIGCIGLLHQYSEKQTWRQWFEGMVKIATGLGAVIGPYLIFTLLQGNTSDVLYAALWYNLGYADIAQTQMSLLGMSLSPSKLFLSIAIAVLALLYHLYRQSKISLTTCIILSVLAIEYCAAIVSGRPYAHYALQVIPGIALLAGYVLQWSVQLPRKFKLVPLAAATVVLIGMWFGFTRGQELASLVTPQSYYPSFVQSYILRDQPHAFAWRYGYEIPRYRQLANYINEYYQSYDSYYFYGNNPWLFTQIEKTFTNKYLFWFHAEQDFENDTHDRNQAELLIIDPKVEGVEEVVASLDEDWESNGSFGGFDLYLKK